MAYAEVADVEARLGRDLDESEAIIAAQRLEDVELLILSRIPNLIALVTDGALSEAVVTMVEADAVIRVLRNPDGIVGETDGNYSYQLNWATVAGRLTLVPEEWRLLGLRSNVFTIAPMLGTPSWCPPCNPNSDFEPDES